jgi:hypothetical protein
MEEDDRVPFAILDVGHLLAVHSRKLLPRHQAYSSR